MGPKNEGVKNFFDKKNEILAKNKVFWFSRLGALGGVVPHLGHKEKHVNASEMKEMELSTRIRDRRNLRIS